jgi:hypothetical protein
MQERRWAVKKCGQPRGRAAVHGAKTAEVTFFEIPREIAIFIARFSVRFAMDI